MKLTQILKDSLPELHLNLKYDSNKELWLCSMERMDVNEKVIVGKGRTTGESMDDFVKIVRGQTVTIDRPYRNSKQFTFPKDLTV